MQEKITLAKPPNPLKTLDNCHAKRVITPIMAMPKYIPCKRFTSTSLFPHTQCKLILFHISVKVDYGKQKGLFFPHLPSILALSVICP